MKKKGERFYLGNVRFFLQEKTKLQNVTYRAARE